MQFSITYVHHNCFILDSPTQTYLFDFPDDQHVPEGARELVTQAVAGKELAVFISHSHDDHLNGDLGSLTSGAKRVCYVVSDDVPDMRPDAVPDNGEVLVVEPDTSYEFNGLRIETLLSNDLGVAFLVEDAHLRLYYGGDLAKWIWKGASSREKEVTERFFKRAMLKVKEFRPHVAFSNVDGRLRNLAGGAEAYREAGANVFVPMHVFGQTGWLPLFKEQVGDTGGELFIYSNPGDRADFSF